MSVAVSAEEAVGHFPRLGDVVNRGCFTTPQFTPPGPCTAKGLQDMRVLRAFVELRSKATLWGAADLLGHLVEAVPYKAHIILTESGTHFAVPTGDGRTPADIKAMRAEGVVFRRHALGFGLR